MKNFTLLSFLTTLACLIFISSCSGPKEVLSADPSATSKYYKIKKKESPAIIVDNKSNPDEIAIQVNHIIEKYTGNPINNFALSKIMKTENGYHWRFLNVKTGKSYIGSANNKFKSVIIYEKPKEKKQIITNL